MKTREELIDLAIGEVVRNVINFPEKVQARLLGQDMGPLRKKLTEAVVTALDSAGGVSPTAPDEREDLIEQATWALIDYDTDVADRGVRDEHYRERRADVERIFPIIAGRSREATTEPQPITDADVEVAAMVLWQDYDSQYGGSDMVQFLDLARAALEAVEASRSPKPTEHADGSGA